METQQMISRKTYRQIPRELRSYLDEETLATLAFVEAFRKISYDIPGPDRMTLGREAFRQLERLHHRAFEQRHEAEQLNEAAERMPTATERAQVKTVMKRAFGRDAESILRAAEEHGARPGSAERNAAILAERNARLPIHKRAMFWRGHENRRELAMRRAALEHRYRVAYSMAYDFGDRYRDGLRAQTQREVAQKTADMLYAAVAVARPAEFSNYVMTYSGNSRANERQAQRDQQATR
jgi:hypothetical protein